MVHTVKAIGFSNSHVWMWELDHKEGLTTKNWCFKIVVLEKALESHLDCKEIKPVNLKGNQSWILIRRTDAEAKASILGHLIGKSWLIGKDPDPWKDWRQEEKRMKEDEVVGFHHWLNGHEFAQTPRNSEGQGSLVFCRSWGCKGSDMTERLNNNLDVKISFSNNFSIPCLI